MSNNKKILPLAAMEKLLKNCGAPRVSEDAKAAMKEALEEYDALTEKYDKIKKDYEESLIHVCPKRLPSLEDIAVDTIRGKNDILFGGISIEGWKKYVEPELKKYDEKKDFSNDDFNLDFLIAYTRAFEYDNRIKKDKEWNIQREKSKRAHEYAVQLLHELAESPELKVLDKVFMMIQTNPEEVNDLFEESYKKSIQYNPEDLRSQLQLEVYQLTNPLSTGTWYPREQFYTELIYLLNQTARCEDTETKKKAATRYLNIAIGYSRHALPPKELQIFRHR